MKRLLVVFTVCTLLLCGCTESPGGGSAPEAATPTPAPTPPPPHVLIYQDEEQAEFTDAVQAAVEERGWTYELTGVLSESWGGYNAVIALRTQEKTELGGLAAAADLGVAISVLDVPGGQAVPAGTAYAHYDAGDIALFTLDEALYYPPHDTPVRLFALLDEEGSPADEAYQLRLKEGKIFDRGAFYGTDAGEAKAFLEEKLGRFVEGLTDAIYIENVALLDTVLAVLEEHGRTDMEVFAVAAGALGEQQAYYKRFVFPLAIGLDYFEEGKRQVDAVALLVEGGVAEERIITPVAAEKTEW